MKTYDVLVKTARGQLMATLDGEPGIPTGLYLQAVMSHQQLVPHLVELRANEADTLLVTTPNRMSLPPGLNVQFQGGVSIGGPLHPSPVPNVPREFAGRTLTHNLRAVVVYDVELDEGTPSSFIEGDTAPHAIDLESDLAAERNRAISHLNRTQLGNGRFA